MVRTQIQLTEEQANRLRRIASMKGISIAELIRNGVDQVLRSYATVDPEERKRRAIRVAGRFRSGCSDLSTRHDKHLSEVYEK
ncbi:MAG: ribbon-helix-helix domain-containing protein [Thermodesulfobacteriota bacterium]